MSGPVYAIVQRWVTMLPVGEADRRVSDQTLADWRHELARAPTWRARQVVNVRSMCAVARTLVKAGIGEAPQVGRSVFMWKLVLVSLFSLGWTLSDGMSVSAERFFLVAPAGKAWMLYALSLLPQVLLPLPFLVFVAEAVGPRRWDTPVLGVMIWIVGIATASTITVPMAMAYLRHQNWFYFGNALTPAPSLDMPGAVILAPVLYLSAVSWLLLTLAHHIRKVGGWAGWSVGLVPMFVLWALVVQLPFVILGLRTAAPLLAWFFLGVRWTTPLIVGWLIVWSIGRLAKIEAAQTSALR